MDNNRRLNPFLYNCFLYTMFRLSLKTSYFENTYEKIHYTKLAEMDDNYQPAYNHHHNEIPHINMKVYLLYYYEVKMDRWL